MRKILQLQNVSTSRSKIKAVEIYLDVRLLISAGVVLSCFASAKMDAMPTRANVPH
jgi:hypothetical protein